MAGGTLTIIGPSYDSFNYIAQRVHCWAGGVGGFQNNARIRLSSFTPTPQLIIPEELFTLGPLMLEPGGTDLLAGYVAGTHIVFNAVGGSFAYQNPTTCGADNAQVPVINSITTNVGGNPLAITLNYANFTGNGVVNVTWGDGTVTNGAAETNAALAHTYPHAGSFGVTVTDASSGLQTATKIDVR